MKGYIELKDIQEPIENAPTLEVKDGKIFVEGVETIDSELIGMAFKDFAEEISKRGHEFDLHIFYSRCI